MFNGTKKLSKRMLELHEIHGMNVRFDGEDDAEAKEEARLAAIKSAEAAQLEGNPEYDRAKQQLDQEKANAVKARQVAEQAQQAVETANRQNADLKQQLADAKVKAASAGITDVTLKEEDYTGDDIALVKAINSIKDQLKAKDEQYKKLEADQKAQKEESLKLTAKQRRSAAYEAILSDLDKDYGAECRNTAVKEFNELNDAGKIDMENPALATRAMEKCYKRAKKTLDKAPGKKKVPLDDGTGGDGSPGYKQVDIKEGTLDEVHEQYEQASKSS